VEAGLESMETLPLLLRTLRLRAALVPPTAGAGGGSALVRLLWCECSVRSTWNLRTCKVCDSYISTHVPVCNRKVESEALGQLNRRRPNCMVHDPFAGPKYKGLAPWQVDPGDGEAAKWQSNTRSTIQPPTNTRAIPPGGINSTELSRFSPTGKIFGDRDPAADKARHQSTIPASLRGDDQKATQQRENGSGHVGDIIHSDYGAKVEPLPQRHAAGQQRRSRSVEPEQPRWMSTSSAGYRPQDTTTIQGATVAGHSSASLSLLGGAEAGAAARLYTPQGGQRPKEEGSPPIDALQPRPDGSGCLDGVLFADYGKKADQEVASVNFARPGKRWTANSDRMKNSSYNLIAGAPQPKVRFGRRSVGPYTGLLSAIAAAPAPAPALAPGGGNVQGGEQTTHMMHGGRMASKQSDGSFRL
jgi:hypothetical protein